MALLLATVSEASAAVAAPIAADPPTAGHGTTTPLYDRRHRLPRQSPNPPATGPAPPTPPVPATLTGGTVIFSTKPPARAVEPQGYRPYRRIQRAQASRQYGSRRSVAASATSRNPGAAWMPGVGAGEIPPNSTVSSAKARRGDRQRSDTASHRLLPPDLLAELERRQTCDRLRLPTRIGTATASKGWKAAGLPTAIIEPQI